jgi:hypothetical protein
LHRIALILFLVPLGAAAQSTPQPKLVYQGHNGSVWVGTYGCGPYTAETQQLVAELKAAVAQKTPEATEQGIHEIEQQGFTGCIVGKSTHWSPTAEFP